MSVFFYLYDNELQPKYTVGMPSDVTKRLRSMTRPLAEDFWSMPLDFGDPSGPWNENTLSKMLNAFTQISAMITSYANWAEQYDNRWNEETYVAMHALATDNTNLSRFVMQKWQQKTFSEVTSETAQNTMRVIAHHQAKQIGFKPTDDNHLAAAIGNPDSFLETLRTSYFYFMEYGPFTDDEFSSFQLDVSYAVVAAHNIIYDLSTSNDAVSRLENADTLTLYGDAYSSMPKEFDCETMAGDLIQFEE